MIIKNMRLDRFFIKFDKNKKNIIVDDESFFNQAKNVLRFKTGDKLILCGGDMSEATAQVIGFGKNSVELEILEIYKNQNEPEKHVVLYCSVLKKENFELAVQKAVEVGVKEIIPVITKRTVKLGLNRDRLNKIIKEAAEQSGRGILSKLHGAVSFDEAVEKVSKEKAANLFFDKSGANTSVFNIQNSNINIFVGPEGGWTEEEIKKAQSGDFVMAGLGKTILRAETAAIIASYKSVNL